MNKPRFSVDLGECELTIWQIWPDGNAPENPTAEDVAEQMRRDGNARRVVEEWNLLDGLLVYGIHDGSQAMVT